MRNAFKNILVLVLICLSTNKVHALAPLIPAIVRACVDFESDSADFTTDSKLALINLRNFIEMQDEQNRPSSIKLEMLYPQQVNRDTKTDIKSVVDLATERQGRIINLLLDVETKRIPEWYFHFNQFQQGDDCNANVDASYYGKNAQSVCKGKDYCGILCNSKECAESQ